MAAAFPDWCKPGAKVWISGGNYGAATRYLAATITRITKASVYAKTVGGTMERRFSQTVTWKGDTKLREYGRNDAWSTYHAYLHAIDSEEVKLNKAAGDRDHAMLLAAAACKEFISGTQKDHPAAARKATAALEKYLALVSDGAQA